MTGTPPAAAALTASGHVAFTVAEGWRPTGLSTLLPLYGVRARRQGADSFDPPVMLRTLTSDVLDLQLYRGVDRDVEITVTP